MVDLAENFGGRGGMGGESQELGELGEDQGVFVEAGGEKESVDLVEGFDGYGFMEEAQKGGFQRM